MLLSKSFDCSDSCMKRMRYSMERFVFLPFSMAGCASSSSVADDKRPHHHQQPRKAAKPAQTNNPPVARGEVAKESTSSTKSKSYSASWALPRPNIARRMQRLIKSFSQIFAYNDEEEEREMEIGFPTDVKHVTHIGLDGLTTITNNPVNKGNNIWDIDIDGAPDHVTSFPSISMDEYEQAMAAQARTSPPPV